MISSEFGKPSAFLEGFDPSLVPTHYGSKLYVWNWRERTLRQEIDLGADGLIPLETRFLHDPSSPHGYVVHMAFVLAFVVVSCVCVCLCLLVDDEHARRKHTQKNTNTTKQPTKTQKKGAALSSNVIAFEVDAASGKVATHVAIRQAWLPVEGWALPSLPPLITDILISLNDKYL